MIPEICPTWFQGFNLAFQVIFLVVTTSISVTACKAYNFFAKEQYKYLSLSFGVFALSYVANIISTVAHVMDGSRIIAIAALYAHAYLFLAAILILLFAYLRIEQASVRAVILILMFGVIGLLNHPAHGMQEMIFHAITAVLLLFIVGQLMIRHKKTCKTSTLVVALGFSLLTAGQLAMIFAAQEFFFVIAAILTLAGFICIGSCRFMVK